MKKKLLTLFFVVTFFALSAVSASALSDDTVVVGLHSAISMTVVILKPWAGRMRRPFP